jgi:hypothetical protein
MQEKSNKKDFVLYNETSSMNPFNDSFSLFLFKRTEKIVLALYLITDHLSDTESIKTSIRKSANQILKDGISVTTKPHVALGQGAMNVCMYEVLSLLDIAASVKLISQKNCILIKDEMVRLLKDIRAHVDSGQSSDTLKRTFFTVDTGAQTDVLYKGHKRHEKAHMSFKAEKPQNENNINPRDLNIKDNRTEKIINLGKEKGSFNVKDASELFVGISEKTIQRELLKLVATGVLKKEGERRWSTYSLA